MATLLTSVAVAADGTGARGSEGSGGGRVDYFKGRFRRVLSAAGAAVSLPLSAGAAAVVCFCF